MLAKFSTSTASAPVQSMIALLPRIEQRHSASRKISHVPRDQRQPVLNRRRRKNRIHVGNRFINSHSSPTVRDRRANRENPIGKMQTGPFEPAFQNSRLLRIFPLFGFHAVTDFAQCHHTEVKIFRTHFFKPTHHSDISPVSLPDFRKNIGIQKITTHSSKAGRLETPLGRSNSIVEAASLNPIKWSLKLQVARPSSVSAEIKIRRCSSSADIPCSAARSRSRFTSPSSRFLTSSCAMTHGAIIDSTSQAASSFPF